MCASTYLRAFVCNHVRLMSMQSTPKYDSQGEKRHRRRVLLRALVLYKNVSNMFHYYTETCSISQIVEHTFLVFVIIF